MRWTLHRVDHGLGVWAGRWDALNEQAFGGHPMLSAAFVNGLLRHFPAPPVYLCVAEGDAAMCLLRPQRLGVWASYLPSQSQIGLSLLKGPIDLQGLLKSLPMTALQLDLLALDPLVNGDEFRAGSQQVCSSPQALTMAIDLAAGDDNYWAGRSKNLRKNMRKHEESAAKEGCELRFLEHSNPTDVVAATERYAALESVGWKGRNGTALAPGNKQHQFYSDLLANASLAGNAHVFELWDRDKLIASRLVIAGPGMAVILKTTYDERYKGIAPGRLLLRHVVRRAHSLWPTRALEFYTNANADQLAWSTRQREMVNMTVYRRLIWAKVADWRRRLQSTAKPAEVQILRMDEDWPPDVQQLFAAAESRRIGYGADWLRHLACAVFGSAEFGSAEARVYVLRRDGRTIAALPVLLKTKDRSVESLSNYYSAIYAPVLAAVPTPADLKPLIVALLADSAGCVSMQFAPMDPTEPVFQALRAAMREAGLLPFDYFCHGNWYQPVNGSADSFLMQRQGILRSTIKRAERRLASLGAQVEILRSESDVDRGIQAFEAVYARSWKKPEPYPDFIPGLMRLCARRGWLRLGLLWLNDQPIAAQLWIVANGRAEIYKLAYAQEHKSLAPGTVLSARLIREVIDVDGVQEIDYLIGDDSYKSLWMSQRRERWGLRAYNPRSPRGLLGWLREVLVRWLRPRRDRADTPPRPRG